MDKIEIIQMTKTEFDNYINSCWSNYIKEHTISGLSISEAKAQVEKAEKELIFPFFSVNICKAEELRLSAVIL